MEDAADISTYDIGSLVATAPGSNDKTLRDSQECGHLPDNDGFLTPVRIVVVCNGAIRKGAAARDPTAMLSGDLR